MGLAPPSYREAAKKLLFVVRYSTKLPLMTNVNTLAIIILYENKQKNNITLFCKQSLKSHKSQAMKI